MRDDRGDIAQRFCTANVIGMEVAVDNMRNGLVTNFRNRLPNVRCVRLRRIHHDDPAIINEEHRLNLVVRDHV